MALPLSCLYCQYLYFDSGDPGYSPMTPGQDMQLECLKGVWEIGYDAGRKTLRENLLTAEKCNHFVWDDEAYSLYVEANKGDIDASST